MASRHLPEENYLNINTGSRLFEISHFSHNETWNILEVTERKRDKDSNKGRKAGSGIDTQTQMVNKTKVEKRLRSRGEKRKRDLVLTGGKERLREHESGSSSLAASLPSTSLFVIHRHICIRASKHY